MNTCFDHLKEPPITSCPPPWRYISSAEVARLLGVSFQTLCNWRVRPNRPVSVVDGKSRRHWYRVSDLLVWLSQGAKSETDILAQWLEVRLGVINATPEYTAYTLRMYDKIHPDPAPRSLRYVH